MDKNLIEIYSKGYKHGYFAGYQAAIEDAMQGRHPIPTGIFIFYQLKLQSYHPGQRTIYTKPDAKL